jgi:hypothetical protein
MGESALLILWLWEPYHNDAVRREKNETTAHRMADREQDRECNGTKDLARSREK